MTETNKRTQGRGKQEEIMDKEEKRTERADEQKKEVLALVKKHEKT